MFWKPFLSGLQCQFVQIDSFARVMALALVCQRHLIGWGPGGHAKSDATYAALRLVTAHPDEIFVQSCGPDMSEDRLWGGPDLNAMASGQVRFNTENSFLMRTYVIFEEMLDMPGPALLSLRDTLSNGALRNGSQMVPMQTRSIFGLTNREPSEEAGMDRSMRALLERFPLEIMVKWGSYAEADYTQLLTKVANRQGASMLDGSLSEELAETRGLYGRCRLGDCATDLAALCARVSASGEIISPRIAIAANEVLRASAAMRGSDCVAEEDFASLVFLPNFGNIEAIYNTWWTEKQDRQQFTLAYSQFSGLMAELQQSPDQGRIETLVAALEELERTMTRQGIAGQVRTTWAKSAA